MFHALRAAMAPLLAASVLVVTAGCHPPAAATEVEELLQRHEYKDAQARLVQALLQHPKSEALWRLRLRLHLAQGQRSEAVEAYRERALSHGEDLALLRGLSLAIVAAGLQSRLPDVRLAAIQVARETDAPELEEGVAARLDDPDPVVRTWAAVALSGRRDGAGVLEEQLRASSPRAREIAVRELGRLAGAAALNILVRAAADPDARVRAAAASALAAVKGPGSIEALQRLLRDPDVGVRASAARTASSMKSPRLGLDLLPLTRDPHLSVRLAAVSSLAALHDSEARPALQALASSLDLFTALRAGLQLARLGDIQPALDAVARALVDREWTVRAAACTTASQLHDRVAIQLTEKAVRDAEPRVRLAAARALLAARPDLRELAAGTARAVQQASCRATRGVLAIPELCVDSSDLLVRAGLGDGMDMLKQLARRGATPALRLAALRGALLLAPSRWLALDGMADSDESIALVAASWTYRHTN